MEGRWERAAVPIAKWAIVPLSVFGFGYFFLGPWLAGADEESDAEPVVVESALVNQQPIEPGVRRWQPVSPPQVSISVTPKEEEEEPLSPDYPFEDEAVPPPIEIPEGGEIDEAGVGGLRPPVASGDGASGAGGAQSPPGEGQTAFRGVGSER